MKTMVTNTGEPVKAEHPAEADSERCDMDESEQFVLFDEYPRYKIAEQAADYIRAACTEKKLRVLEIGANAHKHLRRFLPQDEILFTDIQLSREMEEDPEFLQADGTELPFEDGSFDLVVATDVLEHVPQEKRAALLSEAYRVARHGAVVTFPHNTADVRAAEARVNQFYKSVNGEDYIWLKEHAACGLPDTDEIDGLLDSMGCAYLRLFHGDIRTWERMYYALFSAATSGAKWEFNRYINAYFNQALYTGDVSDSCYRAIYVLWHGEKAPLAAYLDGLMKPGREKDSFLEELLSAQEKIPALRGLLELQKQCVALESHAAYLENQNHAMEERWKADVAQWQQCEDMRHAMEERWQADAAQWRQREDELLRALAGWEAAYNGIVHSWSWRLAGPLRFLKQKVKHLLKTDA